MKKFVVVIIRSNYETAVRFVSAESYDKAEEQVEAETDMGKEGDDDRVMNIEASEIPSGI